MELVTAFSVSFFILLEPVAVADTQQQSNKCLAFFFFLDKYVIGRMKPGYSNVNGRTVLLRQILPEIYI